MKRITLVLLCLAASLGAPLHAGALVWQDFGAGVDPYPAGWSALNFTAEGRIGNAATSPGSAWSGTHEIDVGRNTSGTMTTGQFAWQNRQSYLFELAFDGTTARWTMDKGGASQRSITYSSYGSLAGFDALAFRLRVSPDGGDKLTISDLALNSTALTASPLLWAPGSGQAADRWWGVSDAGNLASGFTLTGRATFDWRNDSSKPGNSNLAFQIKGADAPDVDVNPIPEPGTIALLGGGLLGLGGVIRRRRRAM